MVTLLIGLSHVTLASQSVEEVTSKRVGALTGKRKVPLKYHSNTTSSYPHNNFEHMSVFYPDFLSDYAEVTFLENKQIMHLRIQSHTVSQIKPTKKSMDCVLRCNVSLNTSEFSPSELNLSNLSKLLVFDLRVDLISSAHSVYDITSHLGVSLPLTKHGSRWSEC